MQRAAGEDVATGGAVDQLDPLALSRELHQMLADDVAGAEAGVSRLGAIALRGRTQRKRGTRWRIQLPGVVGLDDVAVPGMQRGGGAFDQILQYRYAKAEIGGPYHRNPVRNTVQSRALLRS